MCYMDVITGHIIMTVNLIGASIFIEVSVCNVKIIFQGVAL